MLCFYSFFNLKWQSIWRAFWTQEDVVRRNLFSIYFDGNWPTIDVNAQTTWHIQIPRFILLLLSYTLFWKETSPNVFSPQVIYNSFPFCFLFLLPPRCCCVICCTFLQWLSYKNLFLESLSVKKKEEKPNKKTNLKGTWSQENLTKK